VPPLHAQSRAQGPPHVPLSDEDKLRSEVLARMRASGMGQMRDPHPGAAGPGDDDDDDYGIDFKDKISKLQARADAGEFRNVPLAEEEIGSSEPTLADRAGAALRTVASAAADVAGAAKQSLGRLLGRQSSDAEASSEL
jgi:hypothetical protein